MRRHLRKVSEELTARALKTDVSKKIKIYKHLQSIWSVIGVQYPAEHSKPFVLTDALVIVSLFQYISAAGRRHVEKDSHIFNYSHL